MKKIFIYGGVLLAIIALIAFNKMTSKSKVPNTYTEVKSGSFEITVSNSGELIAENSLDIKGPQIGRTEDHGPGQQGGGQQGRGGGGGGGGDMRVADLKIQDIVPEGTIVKQGDYIAQLDRTSYANTLKDALDNLTTLQTAVDMKILDTTVALTSLRDDIKNQRYAVEEASIVLAQSKFEPPATIRKAETALDREQRNLEQLIKTYELRNAQNIADIKHQRLHLSQGQRLVTDLQDYLSKFTITAPSDGMVIYKKERNGNKRKAGSNVNPFDLVIATLPDLSSMISKIYINEIDIAKIKPGQKVSINVDAFPTKAYTGNVRTIANVGEVLPNSDAKMFEVQIKVEGSDPALRPSMTTTNKIILKSFDKVVYIPTECVHTGQDSIPFVYEKSGKKQIVILGDSNEKNVIIEKGLEPGTSVYISQPEGAESFKLAGEELIAEIKSHK